MTLVICKQKQDLDQNLIIKTLESSDALLLIESGVYASLNKTSCKAKCFALTEDLKARGLLDAHDNGFEKIDYPGFVELTEQHQKIISV